MMDKILYDDWKKIFDLWFHILITQKHIFINGVNIGDYNAQISP